MAEPAFRRRTYQEYLDLEERSLEKHEFIDGEILAMAGGTVAHAVLSARMSGALSTLERGRGCTTASSDLRLYVPATGLTTYADASVVRGPHERAEHDRNAVCNPRVIVEVLSPKTEAYDRGEKFAHYRQLPSLQDYVLVSTRQVLVEVYHRAEDGSWSLRATGPGERFHVPSLEGSFPVDELYASVELDPAPRGRGRGGRRAGAGPGA